ncbi:hypothetical protein D9758_014445 [Tetrapyrgos nigripes]|uniref:Uncharacterized protein n=1 Tax=Tetrapyrgos nigripes TaxID=182062 RepID=A0A8H5BVU0_9AGAR|nr:hypothetical protein D9758_014445 [Tetrapyrgos nigripes]
MTLRRGRTKSMQDFEKYLAETLATHFPEDDINVTRVVPECSTPARNPSLTDLSKWGAKRAEDEGVFSDVGSDPAADFEFLRSDIFKLSGAITPPNGHIELEALYVLPETESYHHLEDACILAEQPYIAQEIPEADRLFIPGEEQSHFPEAGQPYLPIQDTPFMPVESLYRSVNNQDVSRPILAPEHSPEVPDLPAAIVPVPLAPEDALDLPIVDPPPPSSRRLSPRKRRTSSPPPKDDDCGGGTDDEYRPSRASKPPKRRRIVSAGSSRKGVMPATSSRKAQSACKTTEHTPRGRHGSRSMQANNTEAQLINSMLDKKELGEADFQCPVEDCEYDPQPPTRRTPDFKRHLQTHLRIHNDVTGKGFICKGVLWEDHEKYGIPEDAEAYEYDGQVRVGGCMELFARADSLKRHIDNGNNSCVGWACGRMRGRRFDIGAK